MESEIDDLRAEVRALAERVALLEQLDPQDVPLDTGTFWALNGLRERMAEHPSTEDGAVMLVGSVTLVDGTAEWQQSAGTAGMLEVEWADHASALAALGHPVRLEIVRRILNGMHATSELASIESLGTTGQLHHHLRQLVGAGWVRQSGRGTYEVPTARVVPLLASVLAAQR